LVERAPVGPPGSELGAFAADETVLSGVWRHGSVLRTAVRTVTDQVRGPGRSHRTAPARTDDGPHGAGSVGVAVLASPARQAAYVAHTLRSAHLHDDVPWERMAVVVRSGSLLGDLRRALLAAQVPVEVVGSDLPLRAEPAVRPLLTAAAACAGAALTAEDVAALLASPLVGLDAVGLRRVR